MRSNPLADLQNWFIQCCDNDWEHTFGISIKTMDNPGWDVRIDFEELIYEDMEFPNEEMIGPQPEEATFTFSEADDWYRIWRDRHSFRAYCSPLRLDFVIGRFLDHVAAFEAIVPSVPEDRRQVVLPPPP